jgi:hypothetical protein
MTQLVTVSPSAKHVSGLASRSLHCMYALFTFEQRTAMCFDSDISTAEVGGGAASDAMLQSLIKQ